MTANASDRAIGKCAILLIHGVGDPTPGAVTEQTIKAVSENDSRCHIREYFEVVPLRDAAHRTFPMTVWRGYMGEMELVVAELYWADLSHFKRGWAWLLTAVISIAVGMRYVAGASLVGLPGAARLLRWILQAVAYLMQGPFIAVAIYDISYVLILSLLDALWKPPIPTINGIRDLSAIGQQYHLIDDLNPFGTTIVFAVTALLLVAIGWRWQYHRRIHVSRPLWISIALLACIHIGFVVWATWLPEGSGRFPIYGLGDSAYDQDHSPFVLFWSFLGIIENYLDIVIVDAIAIAFLVYLIAWAFSRSKHRPAINASVGTMTLQYVLLSVLLSLLSLPRDYAIDRVIYHQSSEVLQQSEFLMAAFFRSLEITVLASIVGVIAVTYCIRHCWTRRYEARPWQKDLDPPRLIPPQLAIFLLVVYAAVILDLAVRGSSRLLLKQDLGPSLFEKTLLHFEFVLDFAAIQTMFVLAMIVLSTFPVPARNLLHIVADIVNYMRHHGPIFPVQQKISERFRQVLSRIVNHERPERLLIVAQSQGTVIAVDNLGSTSSAELLSGIENVCLITCGSPLTHIYQRIFPVLYPRLDDTRWHKFRATIPRWTNLFRRDDYVGTYIDGTESDWPRNVALGRGGHTGYWLGPVIPKLLDFLGAEKTSGSN